MSRTTARSVNVAEAERRLSDLPGRVAYGGEMVLITRPGRPMAKLVPPGATGEEPGLAAVRGWLDEDDPYVRGVRRQAVPRGGAPFVGNEALGAHRA